MPRLILYGAEKELAGFIAQAMVKRAPRRKRRAHSVKRNLRRRENEVDSRTLNACRNEVSTPRER